MKLKLNVEDLRVASFETDGIRGRPGTVRAHGLWGRTEVSCRLTCTISCAGSSCLDTYCCGEP